MRNVTLDWKPIIHPVELVSDGNLCLKCFEFQDKKTETNYGTDLEKIN
jgi:hypothetical protein